MRRRRRPKVQVEICTVPTQAGVPAGDLNPYREMDDQEREAVLLDSLARILREVRLNGRVAEDRSAGSTGGHLLPRLDR